VAAPGVVQVDFGEAALDFETGIERKRLRAEFYVTATVVGPSASERHLLLVADRKLHVVRAHAVVRGQTSPSVTWQVRKGTDYTATGKDVFEDPVTTTQTTTVQVTEATGFVKVAQGEALWLVTTATAGSVDELGLALVLKARTDA
jgi:hypothetical protein